MHVPSHKERLDDIHSKVARLSGARMHIYEDDSTSHPEDQLLIMSSTESRVSSEIYGMDIHLQDADEFYQTRRNVFLVVELLNDFYIEWFRESMHRDDKEGPFNGICRPISS